MVIFGVLYVLFLERLCGGGSERLVPCFFFAEKNGVGTEMLF